MMQQMKDLRAQQEAHQNQTKEKKGVKKVAKKTNSVDGWYWENTIASKNNKFVNWQGGLADIVILYRKKA